MRYLKARLRQREIHLPNPLVGLGGGRLNRLQSSAHAKWLQSSENLARNGLISPQAAE
jgi:hypothetical protein